MYDLLVRGGTVLDGTGGPARRADVAVSAGRIVEVGGIAGARAVREIDAAGRYVMPGFIDTHVHGDAAVFDPRVQLAALRQGVTTFVLGQDGVSYAPAGAKTLRYVERYFAPVNGSHPGLDGGTVPVAEQMAGSDAVYQGGHPHPRGWGAFARLLGRHVRELGDWTWEQAPTAPPTRIPAFSPRGSSTSSSTASRSWTTASSGRRIRDGS
jgi:hypothetical protein